MPIFSRASVIDGYDKKGLSLDVVVQGDTITEILPSGSVSSKEAIDCSSLILCPGFVDMHGHSDLQVLRNPLMSEKIMQGITTEVCGNCGIGVFPFHKESPLLKELTKDVLGTYKTLGYRDFNAYKTALSEKGSGTNMAFLQAHSMLRCFAMEGNAQRKASKKEVLTMCKELETSLIQGCVGFSSGLYYAPCIFADDYELQALVSVAASYDRLFCVHMRCEGSDILQSAKQVLNLAAKCKVRLQMSHLKVIGLKNQHLVPHLLQLIDQAHEEGLDVQFDQYPYEYGSTSLFSLLPPEYLKLDRTELQSLLKDENERKLIKDQMEHPNHYDSLASLCGWDQIRPLCLSSNTAYEGLSIADIAQKQGQDPYTAFFDMLSVEQGSALMMDITQSQQSIKQILSHDLMCFGTDALYAGQKAHPRSYHAAIHLLDRYYKTEHVLDLPSMISKMSKKGAERLSLSDRGRIQQGCKADLVLIDLHALKDHSDALHPDRKSEGIKLVMVNGEVAYTEEEGPKGCFGKPLLYS